MSENEQMLLKSHEIEHKLSKSRNGKKLQIFRTTKTLEAKYEGWLH